MNVQKMPVSEGCRCKFAGPERNENIWVSLESLLTSLHVVFTLAVKDHECTKLF